MPIEVTFRESEEGAATGPSRCDRCHWLLVSPVHLNTCRWLDEPIPSWPAGGLSSVGETLRWLGHPANIVDTRLFIVKWESSVPRLSAWKLEELFVDPALAEVILAEHMRKRLRISDEPSYEASGE